MPKRILDSLKVEILEVRKANEGSAGLVLKLFGVPAGTSAKAVREGLLQAAAQEGAAYQLLRRGEVEWRDARPRVRPFYKAEETVAGS